MGGTLSQDKQVKPFSMNSAAQISSKPVPLHVLHLLLLGVFLKTLCSKRVNSNMLIRIIFWILDQAQHVQHLPTVRASQSWKTGSCEKELNVLTGTEEKPSPCILHMSKKNQKEKKHAKAYSTQEGSLQKEDPLHWAGSSGGPTSLQCHHQWVSHQKRASQKLGKTNKQKKKNKKQRNKPARDEGKKTSVRYTFPPLPQWTTWGLPFSFSCTEVLYFFIQILLAECWLLKVLSDLSLAGFKAEKRNVLRCLNLFRQLHFFLKRLPLFYPRAVQQLNVKAGLLWQEMKHTQNVHTRT